jgi:hypothetical protein
VSQFSATYIDDIPYQFAVAANDALWVGTESGIL